MSHFTVLAILPKEGLENTRTQTNIQGKMSGKMLTTTNGFTQNWKKH